jgi:hypothetical protein
MACSKRYMAKDRISRVDTQTQPKNRWHNFVATSEREIPLNNIQLLPTVAQAQQAGVLTQLFFNSPVNN